MFIVIDAGVAAEEDDEEDDDVCAKMGIDSAELRKSNVIKIGK